MAIPDNHLDDLITLSLKTQTIVMPRRKQAVWRHVQWRAARQTIITPYAVPPAPPAPRLNGYRRLAVFVVNILSLVLTDEGRYHRAAENRRSNEGLMFCVGQMIHFYPSSYMGYKAADIR